MCIRDSIKENQDYGYLSIFQLRPSPELSTYAFDDANVEWLHCVAAHRKRLLFLDVEDTMAKYGIIAGKIADDATNATLAAYPVSYTHLDVYKRQNVLRWDR